MTTARDLLEAAWRESLGDANGSVPDAIAATPSGAELLRRADEPRVAEGLPEWRHVNVWESGECDGQSREDMRVPCGCKTPAPAEYVQCHCGHLIHAASNTLPAPRPPEPDRTAALRNRIVYNGESLVREGLLGQMLDDLIAISATPEPDTAALVEALDGLLDYPYIMDAYGCRGCQQSVHSDKCPVGKALAVWSAATMGTETRLRDVAVQESLAATPEPAPVAEMPEDRCPVCWSSATFRLPPDWQDRVSRGQSVPIVGCGNPWHTPPTEAAK